MTAEKETMREGIIIPFWSLTVILVVMNTTMFNIALPKVAVQFALSATSASWIVTGYSIVFAISSITFSRLSDFIPIRRLFMIGLTLLGIASLIGFLSADYITLMIARLLQAAGAASVPGLGIVLVTRYIPMERRGRSMAFIVSAASLGFGLGPVAGGVITQYLGWNYLFAVTGIVLLLIPLFYKVLPKEPTVKVQFDLLGAILIGVGVTSLLLFLTNYTIILLILGLGSLWLLWRRVNRIPNPFIQPALFKNRKYADLLVMGFAAYVTHFATLFVMPIILAHLYGKSSSAIGLLIFPGAILSAIFANYAGKMMDRYGNSIVIRGGHLILLLATVLYALFCGTSPYAFLFIYILMSVSVSALTTSVSNEMSQVLARDQIGAGMGMAQLTQFFGGAIGVALTGMALVHQQSLPLAVGYSNIFWGMSALVLISLFVYLRYASRKKVILFEQPQSNMMN